MKTLAIRDAVLVPTEQALDALRARWHAQCFACSEAPGLGLRFSVDAGNDVVAVWIPKAEAQSYAGLLHGGLSATLLDCAMVNALFAHGLVALTAELRLRYQAPVRLGLPVEVRARLVQSLAPLHRLEAEVRQEGVLRVRAWGKFMERQVPLQKT